MLFKEKIYLSNCDSVRGLDEQEIKKRVLIGLVFGNGIITSPNILFDTKGVSEVLKQKNVIKFLNEEGRGNFVIRGFNIEDIGSFYEYFEKLSDNYKVSSLGGKEKVTLSKSELKEIRDNIKKLDTVINNVHPIYENATILKDSLSNEIKKRITREYFYNDEEFTEFLFKSQDLCSRSEWYNFINDFLNNNVPRINLFKTSIIDPAYNSLFINKSECFIQDNIKILDKIPKKILDGGVLFNSLKSEIELIEYPIKAFEIISTFGSNELVKFITDEALGYMEDKIKDTSLEFFSRRNWFGLYPLLSQKMGVEIK